MSEEELIDDQYQLVMCVASGSSSQVWEVTEKSTARHLAMKLLKKDVPEFKENKAILRRESEVLKSLDHPMIVKFEKYESNRDNTYILMEYFRAANLKLQIKADTNKVHLRIRQLFEGICSALAHVHSKGYVHRDIKPDNILLSKSGEIRLVDFSLSSKQKKGLARFFAGRLRNIQGTRTYIAPETIRRQQPSFQTDMYSLGVVFFEVLTCRTPFQAQHPQELLQKHLKLEAPNPSEFNTNVTPEMDRIVAKLLKKKPAERPASVDEVLAEIKRIRIFKEDVVDAIAAKKASEDDDALAMLSESRLDSRADAKLKEMLATNPEFARKFAEEKASKATKKKALNDVQNARIKVNEDAEAARAKHKAGLTGAVPQAAAPAAVAAPVQPPPPMMPQQMPMPMPGYPSYPQGYPSYPPGYAPFPQAQMPMQPGMMPPMPGGPQYPQQPQMGYPQQMPQQQMPYPAQQPQQVGQVNRPPVQQSPQAPPQPVPRQAAPPAQAAPTRQPQTAPPARPAAPAPARPAPKPAPPAQPAAPPPADADFMTELPDVL